MVSIFARICLRLGLRERLKRTDRERPWVVDDFERKSKMGMASSICASKFLFCGLTLVR